MSRGLLILFSVVVLDLIGFGIVVPILPFYAREFGASAAVLGILLTSYSAMQFLFSPLWGRLSDRIGRKPVILLTLTGSCLSLLIVGTAGSLVQLFVGRILSGIFAANISVASATMADITTDDNRAQGMGLIGAGFGIGFVLGPAIGGLLSRYGYQAPMLAAAGLTFANVIYTALRLQEPARHLPSVESLAEERRVLADRSIFSLCFVYFIFSLSMTQLESVFAFFMMDRFHYDATHVAYILTAMALLMIAVQGGAIKKLSGRFGEKNLLVGGAVLLTVGFVTLALSYRLLWLLLPIALAGIGRGLSQPSLLSLVSKRAKPHLRGAVMGTFQASASLGRVIGPVIAGALYDQWHPSPFYLAAGLMVIVLALTLKL